MIDERAIVHPGARLAESVHVGPWSVIGDQVKIGEGTRIGPHVVINGPTTIGSECEIFQFASIGEVSQDKKYTGGASYLEIGDNNVIRECVTMNRSTDKGGVTRIGDHNLFMAYSHVAHDCTVGNHTVFSNNASLSGHVQVDDYAILGGFAAIHQFCRIGAYSFIAMGTLVSKDVAPYVLVSAAKGSPATHGLNVVGLKRHNFSEQSIRLLNRAYKIIFRQGLTVDVALCELDLLVVDCPEVQLLIDMLRESERGLVR